MLKQQQAQDLAKRKVVKEVHLNENGTGYSYEQLFGKYLDGGVREMIIEEPYLGRPFQLFNLLMFIELSVTNCGNLKIVKVITKRGDDVKEQTDAFAHIKSDLQFKDVKFVVEFNEALHDRSIV